MDDSQPKTAALLAKAEQLILLFEAKEELEKKLLVPLARQWGVPNVTRDLTLSEVRVTEMIGNEDAINVTKLAEKMELTKGAITKICAKLVRRGWIEKMPSESNLKEVHYRLTPDGNIVHDANLRYRAMEAAQFGQFIAPYSEEELRFLDRFMDDAAAAMKRGLTAIKEMTEGP
ncbi:MarR family transcriptional regulator [Paenibacillus silvisoli]|uniref:MarR family transcriptional regulator n=1 Tax=Paenibacillus silvisoli TaxID=3110539 RepID=UPI002803A3EA|nr:MarR family transcriptional regulator [Paenibacillus silvisoli]